MSLHLKKFTLKKEYRNIQPFSVEFIDGINVIVGENGAGKSSILNLITGENNKELFSLSAEKVEFRFFDTEKQNPRIQDPNLSKNFGFSLATRFESHGEAMLPIILASKDFKNVILFVDEPEAGISLTNQMKIFECFQSIIKNRCQIVLTTHSYVFIKSVDVVFSLETKTWISSSEYLDSIFGRKVKTVDTMIKRRRKNGSITLSSKTHQKNGSC